MKRQRWSPFIRFLVASLFYLAIFLYVVIFNHSTGWLLFYFLTMLFLLNLVTLIPSLKKIQCQFNQSSDYELYQKAQINVVVFRHHSTVIRLPLFTITLNGKQQRIPLYSGKPEKLSFSWEPKTRGVFSHFPMELTSSDLFGLFTKKLALPLVGPFIVMPRLQLSLAEQLHQHLSQLQPSFYQLIGHQTFSIKNFREYQTGDSFKSIDWKQSSKRDTLMIKEFENEKERENYFLFYGVAHENFEELVSVYYSFTQFIKDKTSFQQLILAEDVAIDSNVSVFARLQPLMEDCLLPDFSNKKLVVFTAVHTEKLTKQVQRLEKHNELFLVYVHSNKIFLSWKDQTIVLKHKGGQ